MSSEYDNYTVTCTACGHTGRLVISSDDRNRMEADWEGFAGTKKAYFFKAGASWARCKKCGNEEKSRIEITFVSSNQDAAPL